MNLLSLSIHFRYRKINLYDEDKFTPGKIEDIENAVFTTDFGRTFGTFICFDILFYNPSRQILNLNRTTVTDIVYPTAWYSIMPFYHCKYDNFFAFGRKFLNNLFSLDTSDQRVSTDGVDNKRRTLIFYKNIITIQKS